MSNWIVICAEKKRELPEFTCIAKFLQQVGDELYFWPQDQNAVAQLQTADFLLVGGDGTLNFFVNLYQEHDWFRLAGIVHYVPMGTGNDFARSLGFDLEAFSNQRLDFFRSLYQGGQSKNVRYAKCNERFFINTASGGSFALPVRDSSEEAKNFLGPLAYYQSALSKIVDPKLYDLELDLDGKNFCLRSYGFFIANGSFTGGGFLIDQHNELDSSYLKIILFKEGAMFKQLVDSLVHQFSLEHQWDEGSVVVARARVIGIKSHGLIPMNLDGEVYDQSELSFLPSNDCLQFKVL